MLGTHGVTVFKERHGQWFGLRRPRRRESRGGSESIMPFFEFENSRLKCYQLPI